MAISQVGFGRSLEVWVWTGFIVSRASFGRTLRRRHRFGICAYEAKGEVCVGLGMLINLELILEHTRLLGVEDHDCIYREAM